MIIAICNQKGGVGKSTLTFNLGYLLAEQGKKTLVVDFDPQGSLTTIFDLEKREADIYNVVVDSMHPEEAIIHVEENLDLLPGGINLSTAEIELASAKGRESFLKNAIVSIKDQYDAILIDCLPSLGLLLINALNAADKVIIPTATDYLSYRGLELLLNTIANVKVNMNKELDILGVVATGHDNRTLHSREVLELLEDEFNVLGIVGISTKVKDAAVSGEPIHRYDKKHKIAEQYKNIAGGIING